MKIKVSQYTNKAILAKILLDYTILLLIEMCVKCLQMYIHTLQTRTEDIQLPEEMFTDNNFEQNVEASLDTIFDQFPSVEEKEGEAPNEVNNEQPSCSTNNSVQDSSLVQNYDPSEEGSMKIIVELLDSYSTSYDQVAFASSSAKLDIPTVSNDCQLNPELDNIPCNQLIYAPEVPVAAISYYLDGSDIENAFNEYNVDVNFNYPSTSSCHPRRHKKRFRSCRQIPAYRKINSSKSSIQKRKVHVKPSRRSPRFLQCESDTIVKAIENNKEADVKAQHVELNILVTQCELFAHFIMKQNGRTFNDPSTIMAHLHNKPTSKILVEDGLQSEALKSDLQANAMRALCDLILRKQRFLNQEVAKSIPENLVSPNFSNNLENPETETFYWFPELYNSGLCGVLMYETISERMIQSVKLLHSFTQKNLKWSPILIITSSEEIRKWQNVIAKVFPYHCILCYNDCPKNLSKLENILVNDVHIVIVRFHKFTNDICKFLKIQWQYIIFDHISCSDDINRICIAASHDMTYNNFLLLRKAPHQNDIRILLETLQYVLPNIFHNQPKYQIWMHQLLEKCISNRFMISDNLLERMRDILRQFMLKKCAHAESSSADC